MGKYFENKQTSWFSLDFHLQISSAIDDFYLQNLLLFCLPNWDFISIAIIPSVLINWNFTAWNSYSFHHLFLDLVIYVYQYELMDMYFILWVIVHHYHYYFVAGMVSYLSTGSYSDIWTCLNFLKTFLPSGP